MNEATNIAAEPRTRKPMRYGRAMKLDLSRADDATLEEAYAFLDAYDTAGKASAWVQEDIDERLQAINDETDRRAGIEPVYVERQPSLREVYEAAAKAGELADDEPAEVHDVPEGAHFGDLIGTL